MKLVIDNFRRSTNGHAVGGHRLIKGFIPHYEALADEDQDANFKQKVNPSFPLVLGPRLETLRRKTGQFPVVAVANEHNALGKIIYVTDLWQVFSDGDDETSLGVPDGTTPASNTLIDLVLHNGKILTSHALEGIYSGAISGTPSWAAVTDSGGLITQSRHTMDTFEDRVHVTNAASGALTRINQVLIINAAFETSLGIDLGDTFNILNMANYQDRYRLLFCERTTAPKLIKNTTVFLWNGVAGDSYDAKPTLPGTYVASIVRDGAVYAFTQQGSTLIASVFEGGSFREVGRIRNTRVLTTGNVKMRVAIEGEFFVLMAKSGDLMDGHAPLYWNPFTGDAFYAANDEAIDDNGFSGILIATDAATDRYARYVTRTDDDPDGGSIMTMEMESHGTAYVSDFYDIANADGEYDLVAGGGNVGAGQSFTAFGGKVSKVTFSLKKAGSPTGTMTAKLYAHSGTFGTSSVPTGPALATAAANAASLTTSFALVEFEFATPYQTVAGTKYVVTLEHADGDGSNYVAVENDDTSPTHGGNASTLTASWAAQSEDLLFYVTEELPAVAEYYSNVIPAPAVEGLHDNDDIGRMTVKQLDLHFNAKPPTDDDSISVTLTSKDDMETETYTTATATVKDTDANSTDARVNNKRAIINEGATATEISVDLVVTATSTDWSPVIRRIVVEADPVAP